MCFRLPPPNPKIKNGKPGGGLDIFLDFGGPSADAALCSNQSLRKRRRKPAPCNPPLYPNDSFIGYLFHRMTASSNGWFEWQFRVPRKTRYKYSISYIYIIYIYIYIYILESILWYYIMIIAYLLYNWLVAYLLLIYWFIVSLLSAASVPNRAVRCKGMLPSTKS